MANEMSHCDFLIPNLFGRCQCVQPAKQIGGVCVDDESNITPIFSKPQQQSGQTSTTTTLNNFYDDDVIVIENEILVNGDKHDGKIKDGPSDHKIVTEIKVVSPNREIEPGTTDDIKLPNTSNTTLYKDNNKIVANILYKNENLSKNDANNLNQSQQNSFGTNLHSSLLNNSFDDSTTTAKSIITQKVSTDILNQPNWSATETYTYTTIINNKILSATTDISFNMSDEKKTMVETYADFDKNHNDSTLNSPTTNYESTTDNNSHNAIINDENIISSSENDLGFTEIIDSTTNAPIDTTMQHFLLNRLTTIEHNDLAINSGTSQSISVTKSTIKPYLAVKQNRRNEHRFNKPGKHK